MTGRSGGGEGEEGAGGVRVVGVVVTLAPPGARAGSSRMPVDE